MLYHHRIFREYSLVKFEKVISSVSIKEERLEGRDFETVL
jgi:hypothetical protein